MNEACGSAQVSSISLHLSLSPLPFSTPSSFSPRSHVAQVGHDTSLMC